MQSLSFESKQDDMQLSKATSQLTRLQTVHSTGPRYGCRQICVCPMASGCGLPPHIYILATIVYKVHIEVPQLYYKGPPQQ